MYAHIDCNNFFVSCERLFRPELEGKPVAVLSNNDGCFISRSTEVKALGFPMGAPLFKYKNEVKLHNVTLFSANFSLYGEISERIVLLLRSITPLIEVYSIDECFLDLTELNYTDLTTWAKNIQNMIQKQVGIPVSIGVGSTKTLAKVATNYAKKHGGIAIIDTEATRRNVLEHLAVEDVWGIGWRTAPKLKDRGVSNAWQLVQASDAWLRQQLNISGMRMVDELRGHVRLRFGDTHEQRKSIMVSRSFGHKVRDHYQLESATATFAARAAARLRKQRSVCGTVLVYLTTNQFDETQRRVSKQRRLVEVTADTGNIITTATELLGELYDSDFAYQKVAVVLLDIVDIHAWQLSLTDPVYNREERGVLMSSLDVLNKKYPRVVYYASERIAVPHWHSKHTLRSPAYTTSWVALPVVRA